MKKKSKKKVKKGIESRPLKQNEASAASADDSNRDSQQEDAFNFGGLPQRDLKKNLGCG